MRTAVITINYNSPHDTEKCLKSIYECSPEIPVVVVDNASTKGDIEAVCRKFDNVKLILNKENIGFGRANNVGIKWALKNTDARYMFVLNNDAYVEPDTIHVLEEYLDGNPQVDGCSPRIVFADNPDKLWYGGGEINWRRGGARAWGYLVEFDGDIRVSEVSFITGCAMMLRRELIGRVGGFDPRFFMYAEDVEFCGRIIRNGGRLAYVPASVVYHRVYGSIKQDGDSFDIYESPDNKMLPFYLENAVCNHLLAHNAHAQGMDKLLGNAYMFARWIYWSLKYIFRGRLDAVSAILKGYSRFLEVRKQTFVNELDETLNG